MSKYAIQQTQFHDDKLLIDALKELGFNDVEHHETAQSLFGYRGDERKDKAEIIIRRQYVGSASNDIGFKRGTDGQYAAIISEYDSNRYNQQWLTKLKKSYMTREKIQLAKRAGLRFVSAKPNEKGEIVIKMLG